MEAGRLVGWMSETKMGREESTLVVGSLWRHLRGGGAGTHWRGCEANRRRDAGGLH
jgi:hypothetical protein